MSEPESEWGSELLDVGACLHRIGHAGSVEPTADTLRALHGAHVAAIPFENVDVLLRRPIQLDVESLQGKMIRHRRGGYCYERNILLSALLERLGFPVDRLLARVNWGDRAGPRTHAVLRVRVDGRDWLADTGFGGNGLLEPVPLVDGTESRQGDWAYRVDAGDLGAFRLSTWRPSGWEEMYTVLPDVQHPIDYRVCNHYTSTHPRSPFIKRPIIQRATPTERFGLDGTEFTVSRPDGTRETRQVEPGELDDLLVHTFGIELEPADVKRLIEE